MMIIMIMIIICIITCSKETYKIKLENKKTINNRKVI